MDANEFLREHGYWVLLLAVLADQSGLPLPAAPFLLAAGALVQAGTLRFWPLLILSILGSMVGHTAWFIAGRERGVSMLRRVCALSLEPDACVQRTQDLFTRMGPISLLVARFIPGLDTLAQPLAGMSGMSLGRYLGLSVVGATLWAGGLMFLGQVFGAQLGEMVQPLEHLLRRWLVPFLASGFAVYFCYKLVQRYRALRDIRMARITVDELKTRMDAGESLVVFDLRHPLEARLHPHTIPGALRMDRREIDERVATLKPDQEIVLFCNCPHEIASARLALSMLRRGHVKVRPLEGGLDAWQRKQFPLEPFKGPPPPNTKDPLMT